MKTSSTPLVSCKQWKVIALVASFLALSLGILLVCVYVQRDKKIASGNAEIKRLEKLLPHPEGELILEDSDEPRMFDGRLDPIEHSKRLDYRAAYAAEQFNHAKEDMETVNQILAPYPNVRAPHEMFTPKERVLSQLVMHFGAVYEEKERLLHEADKAVLDYRDSLKDELKEAVDRQQKK